MQSVPEEERDSLEISRRSMSNNTSRVSIQPAHFGKSTSELPDSVRQGELEVLVASLCDTVERLQQQISQSASDHARERLTFEVWLEVVCFFDNVTDFACKVLNTFSRVVSASLFQCVPLPWLTTVWGHADTFLSSWGQTDAVCLAHVKWCQCEMKLDGTKATSDVGKKNSVITGVSVQSERVSLWTWAARLSEWEWQWLKMSNSPPIWGRIGAGPFRMCARSLALFKSRHSCVNWVEGGCEWRTNLRVVFSKHKE